MRRRWCCGTAGAGWTRGAPCSSSAGSRMPKAACPWTRTSWRPTRWRAPPGASCAPLAPRRRSCGRPGAQVRRRSRPSGQGTDPGGVPPYHLEPMLEDSSRDLLSGLRGARERLEAAAAAGEGAAAAAQAAAAEVLAGAPAEGLRGGWATAAISEVLDAADALRALRRELGKAEELPAQERLREEEGLREEPAAQAEKFAEGGPVSGLALVGEVEAFVQAVALGCLEELAQQGPEAPTPSGAPPRSARPVQTLPHPDDTPRSDFCVAP
ncbi:unnamed protein product [Prorocentrum cordatum]|uniref:Uncharacterized protein n=1 Tax=Prorocentrum cordatum TaxID=2364126 RepID=A0ABN9WRF3_9DINO|nr:unnamed protein product [Polarella glacialis]